MSALLWHAFSGVFVLMLLATFVVYVGWTVVLTQLSAERRMVANKCVRRSPAHAEPRRVWTSRAGFVQPSQPRMNALHTPCLPAAHRLDAEASGKAVDALLNYETVALFGARAPTSVNHSLPLPRKLPRRRCRGLFYLMISHHRAH